MDSFLFLLVQSLHWSRPARGSSVVFVRPVLNSATQRLIVVFVGEDSPSAVSYTHLDVYKRQLYGKYHITLYTTQCPPIHPMMYEIFDLTAFIESDPPRACRTHTLSLIHI